MDIHAGLGLRVMVVAGLLLQPYWVQAEDKPAPPPLDVPKLQDAQLVGGCVRCEPLFKIGTHKILLNDLVNNLYLSRLRLALYNQDITHQFQSRAHFDNCDFDGALRYTTSLLEEVDTRVSEATIAQKHGDELEKHSALLSAFFALGQALHATQDFYAHTNYVELMVPGAKNVGEVAVVPTWTAAGRRQVEALSQKGLVSGFVFWGFPQKCSNTTPSHSALAKDSKTTKSGKLTIPHLNGITQYEVAVNVASRASQSLMRYAFERWPLLEQANGSQIAFDVMVDARKF